MLTGYLKTYQEDKVLFTNESASSNQFLTVAFFGKKRTWGSFEPATLEAPAL